VKEVQEEAQRSKMAMPKVEVPDDLAENTLLKVVKHQIRVLHAEMDNTKEDNWPSGKSSIGGRRNGMKIIRARPM
jgi:transitional endoplasmic reticulum ATPase